MADEYADPDLDSGSDSSGGGSAVMDRPSGGDSGSRSSSDTSSSYDFDEPLDYLAGNSDDETVDDAPAEVAAIDKPAKDAPSKTDAVATDAATTAEEPIETETDDDDGLSDTDAVAPDKTPVTNGAFDAETLSLAEQYGFTAAEAQSFGTVKNLETALTALDRRAAAFGRQQLQPATDPAATETSGGVDLTETPVARPNGATEMTEFEKFQVNLDPTQFDEETIQIVNGLNDHYDSVARHQSAEIAAMRQQLSAVTGRHQAETQQRFSNDMDTFFDGLGETYREQYGAGRINSLPPNSPAKVSRQRFVEEMNALLVADQQLGRRSSLADLQKRTLRVLHGDSIEQQARAKIVQDVQHRRNQSVSRPTSRTTRTRSPEEAAKEFANKFYKERGADKDDSYDGEL